MDFDLLPSQIELVIIDLDLLYKSYMPFLKTGGIYFFSHEPLKLGDAVTLKLTLNVEGHRDVYTLPTKIVWKGPKRPRQGYGVAFGEDEEAKSVKRTIESLLDGVKDSGKKTFTM